MWLPSPVYERAPHYWILLGLLLIITGSYLGLQGTTIYLYLGVPVGVASCAWGIRVLMRRKIQRPSVDPELDQTCELNYKPD